MISDAEREARQDAAEIEYHASHAHCACGHCLHAYAFADQGDGLDHYDAWATHPDDAQVFADGRGDVLAWRTDFRRPLHDVVSATRTLITPGACRA